MLANILNSERAVRVSVQIVRTFVRLRETLSTHADLARKITVMEKKYDSQFKVVFEAIRQLMTPPVKPKRKIGFDLKEKNRPGMERKRILRWNPGPIIQTDQTNQKDQKTRND